jgi:hypothetical protein
LHTKIFGPGDIADLLMVAKKVNFLQSTQILKKIEISSSLSPFIAYIAENFAINKGIMRISRPVEMGSSHPLYPITSRTLFH